MTRGFASQGELVGAYAALLTGTASLLNVQALEDSRLLAMEHAALSALYARHPAWNTLGRRIAEQLFVEREQREFELLTLSPAERYDRFQRSKARLVERIPQYQIASYLGITPVSLSRIRANRRRRSPAP